MLYSFGQHPFRFPPEFNDFNDSSSWSNHMQQVLRKLPQPWFSIRFVWSLVHPWWHHSFIHGCIQRCSIFHVSCWISSYLCYLPKPSASADNIDLGFDNSWYAQPHPIIVYYLQKEKWLVTAFLPNVLNFSLKKKKKELGIYSGMSSGITKLRNSGTPKQQKFDANEYTYLRWCKIIRICEKTNRMRMLLYVAFHPVNRAKIARKGLETERSSRISRIPCLVVRLSLSGTVR